LFRQLSEEQTASFRNRVVGYFGLASLASAFRSLHGVAPQTTGKSRPLSASLVYMMHPKDLIDSVIRGIGFNVILGVTPDELGNREELTRTLVRQMRDRINTGAELGMMQMAAFAARRPQMTRRRLESLVKNQLSLVYGFFVSPAGLRRLCDVPIERAYHVTSVSAPPGFAVVANECCGRLSLAITHSAESVPRPVVEAYADAFVKDLL
jgi:hypothetical protein